MKKYTHEYENKILNKTLFIVIILVGVLLITYIYLNRTSVEYLYDFEDDTINSFPMGFVGVGRNITNIKVVEWDVDDEYDGNVVYVNYLEENDYGGVELNTLFSRATEGFVSFDIYIVHNLRIRMDICQEDLIYDSIDDISVSFSENQLIESDKWYHIEINFNCQEYTWDVKIYEEGILIKFDVYSFSVQSSYMCQLYFATYGVGSEFYIDNVYILPGDV